MNVQSKIPRPAGHDRRGGQNPKSKIRQSAPRLVALFMLICSVGLSWVGRPDVQTAGPVVEVPQRVGLWVGTPLPVEARTIDILETDNVTLMEYRLGEEPPVWFARVADFGNRAAFHPPELCYVGSHFEILVREPIEVMAGGRPQRLMRLVIAQDGQQFESWYWFTANGRVTPNYYQQQFWLLLGAMGRRTMSGTLVRLSTPMDEPSAAHRRLLAFLTSFSSQDATHQVARHDL